MAIDDLSILSIYNSSIYIIQIAYIYTNLITRHKNMNFIRIASQRVARPASRTVARRTFSSGHEPANDLAVREISIGLGLGAVSALLWVGYARSEKQVVDDYYNALAKKNKA